MTIKGKLCTAKFNSLIVFLEIRIDNQLSVERHSILNEELGGTFVLTRSYSHKCLESAHSRLSVGRALEEIRLRIRFAIGLIVI